MIRGGWIRRSTARQQASSRLPGRRLYRWLVLEALEVRMCPVLTLTPANLNAGLGLSVFATGFPVASFGAMSVLFRDQGGELVSSFDGEVRLLPQDNVSKNAWRQLFSLVDHRKQVLHGLPQSLAIALIAHVGQLR